MRHLKIIKNLNLKKSNSLIEIYNTREKIKNCCKRKNLRLNNIYRYYFSKNQIQAKLLKQQISKMNEDLLQKQKKEKKLFRDEFFRKYPMEENYENEKNNFTMQIIKYKKEQNMDEAKKCEEEKEKFLNQKHDEYIDKLGIEYEKALEKLKEKFDKEQKEQKLQIKRIVLNFQVKEIENQEQKTSTAFNKKNRNFGGYYFFNKDNDIGNLNNEDNPDINNNENYLRSRVFKFGVNGNPYQTILI